MDAHSRPETPEADNHHTTTLVPTPRRALFAGAGALALGTVTPLRVAAQASDCDAWLLGCCARFRGLDAMQRHMDAHPDWFTDEQVADVGRCLLALDRRS
jgi:hypothetical protein